MSPTATLARQLVLTQKLYAGLLMQLTPEPGAWFALEPPLKRLAAACAELSAQPEAYAVGLLYLFACKPGRRDVGNKLLTEPLAHALAAAIVSRWEEAVWACLSRPVQRRLDKIDFCAWQLPRPAVVAGQ